MSSVPKLQGLKIGCYPKGYAAPSDVPCQCNMRRSPSKLKRTLPQSKTYVTSKSPVGDISVVTLIRTDTTLDHSQKAEKVWSKGHVDCKGTPPRETKVRVRVALGRYNAS